MKSSQLVLHGSLPSDTVIWLLVLPLGGVKMLKNLDIKKLKASLVKRVSDAQLPLTDSCRDWHARVRFSSPAGNGWFVN